MFKDKIDQNNILLDISVIFKDKKFQQDATNKEGHGKLDNQKFARLISQMRENLESFLSFFQEYTSFTPGIVQIQFEHNC